MNNKVLIRRLITHIPGFDVLLGGGIPEFSLNLIAGEPGSGKTTLAHQIMFALVKPECRALYFTILGEPALKLLRYQQQFSFFDLSQVNKTIRFVNLSKELSEGHLDDVLQRISEEVKKFTPGLVFVDSLRAVIHTGQAMQADHAALQRFTHQLSVQMASWQATTFLLGENTVLEQMSNPIMTVADGIVWLTQNLHRNSMVRKIQVPKMRGQAQTPGLLTFGISDAGIQVFPRRIIQSESEGKDTGGRRLSMGIPALDDMLAGGLPAGYALLLVGPSGSGKTVLATQFLAAGAAAGEPGIIAAFEKSPSQLLSFTLSNLVKAGQVDVIDTRSLNLSVDETLQSMVDLIQKKKVKRVVIDSLSGFELALAPEFREDYRESLYRMVSTLTGMDTTVVMTAELEDRYDDLRFSPYGNAFLADAIIVLRYIEVDAQLKRVMAVVKVRGSPHSKELRTFEIEGGGLVIGECLSQYEGILTGHPSKVRAAKSAEKGDRHE